MAVNGEPTVVVSDVRPETRALVAQWQKEEQAFWSRGDPQPDDFLDRWLPAAGPFFDAGWNGDGIAPSARISLRYCMMMSGSWQQRDYAERFVEWVKAEARARIKRGYHPFPLTDLRPAVTGAAIALPAD